MRILEWNTLDAAAQRAALARPVLASHDETLQAARLIVADVRRRGDAAVREFTARLDGAHLQQLAVTAQEFRQARAQLGAAQLAAMEHAIANVRAFHQAQLPPPLSLEVRPGVRCELLPRAIGSVGLYVPAGNAPLPSSVIMLAIPATLAGCPVRVLCTPPAPDGRAAAAVLAAAQLCGIDTVFKIGGAQAIAALAYGTESIPRVAKIFGPGNAWVTAAKQLVAADPAGAHCDLPAGPSEVMVIADDSARADFVAADLLAQAEHDPLAQALLITTSAALAAAVAAALEQALPRLSRGAILQQSLRACRALRVPDMETALALANDYAPEHLLLQVREPRRWLARVNHAGSVFLGPLTPETLGDYCSGTNHVLPTFGHARACSGLSVRDFMRSMSVQEVSGAGLAALGPVAVTLAQLEGLDAHAHAVTCRLATLAAHGASRGDLQGALA
ncbi:MAG: histidinol dehydrogenase [Proteobacteria bacterium]|nr:histidinol dehydrogenase [Pseudomonadota bacterium]